MTSLISEMNPLHDHFVLEGGITCFSSPLIPFNSRSLISLKRSKILFMVLNMETKCKLTAYSSNIVL